MRFMYDAAGGQQLIRDVVVKHNGTKMPKGAVVIASAVDGEQPFAVIGSGALPDVVGVLEEDALDTETDSLIAGTAQLKKKVSIGPAHVYLAEYSQAGSLAPTSASSSTTFNLTSIEDITGGWVYIVSGASKGQLQYIVAGTTNELTTKTAFSPVADTDAVVIKILPTWAQLASVVTAADKLESQAAAGSAKMRIIKNYIEADNIPFQELDPLVHSGLTGLSTLHPRFWAEVMFLDHVMNIV